MDPNPLVLPPVSTALEPTSGELILEKVAQIKAAGLQKRAKMSGITLKEQLNREFLRDTQTKTDGELANTYGAQLLGEYKQRQAAQDRLIDTANRGRTSEELVKDTGLSLLSGSTNLVAGTAVLGQDIVSKQANTYTNLAALAANKLGILSDKSALGLIQGATTARADLLAPQQKLLGDFNNWREEAASSVKQADQTLMRQENAEVATGNQASYEQALKAGDNKALALLAREGKGAWQGAKNLLNHPTVAMDTIVEQAPSLLTGVLAKGAVAASRLARVGEAAEVAAGRGLLAPAKMKLLAEARQTAADKLVNQNIRTIVTGTEMGSAYSQSVGGIATMPWDELVKRFPGAQVDKEAGIPENQVRQQLASELGLTSAALTGVVAYPSAFLSQDFLRNPMGKGVATTLKKVGKNLAEQAGEASEEFLQGSGGQVAQNTAALLAGDTTVGDIFEGSGEAGGQGAAAALGTTAAVRSPGLAVGTTVLGAKGALNAAGAAFKGAGHVVDAVGNSKFFSASGDKARAKGKAQTAEQAAAQQAATTEAATTLTEALKDAPAASAEAGAAPAAEAPLAAKVTAPVSADPILTPANEALLQGQDEAASTPLNTVQALARALQHMEDPSLPDAQWQDLSLFAMKTARSLSQALPEIKDPAVRKAVDTLLAHPSIAQAEEFVKDTQPELVEAKLALLSEDLIPDDAALSPEQQQALSQLAEIVTAAPGKLTTAQTEQLLKHGDKLDPDQREGVVLAHGLSQAEDDYTSQIKSMGEVGRNVFSTGFQLGENKLPSLKEMANGVVQAINAGDTEGASKSLQQLFTFAKSRQDKAANFDATARQAIEEGKSDVGVAVPDTHQLSGITEIGEKPNWLIMSKPASRKLIEAVHVDAQASANFYNLLAKRFPNLVASTEIKGQALPVSLKVASPTYASASPGSAPASETAAPAETPVVAAAPNAESAPTADRREDNGQRQQATDRREDTEQRAKIDELSSEQQEIAKLKARNAELEAEQRTSAVTGLPNQKAFTADESLGWGTVAAADMDGLKKLNDAVGHEGADVVLQALGNFLKLFESNTVRFYHRSGDEFAARFKDKAEAASVMKEVQELLESAKVHFTVAGINYTYNGIGFSVGHGASYEAADTAVNADKATRLDAGIRENPRDAGTPRRLSTASTEGEGEQSESGNAQEEVTTAQTVAEHLPGLHTTLGEGGQAENLNKLLTGFKLAKNSLSPLVRFADFRQALNDAFAAGKDKLAAVRQLYAGQHQSLLSADDAQLESLRVLLTEKVPEVAERLNAMLQASSEGATAKQTVRTGWRSVEVLDDQGNKVRQNQRTGKQPWFARLFKKDGSPLWVYKEKLSLHAAQWDESTGKIQYQPKVLEAMSLAAVQFVMNKIVTPIDPDWVDLGIRFPEGMPKELKTAFRTMHEKYGMVDAVAQTIQELLGVTSNGEVSQTYSDGLPKALALDVLAALENLNVIRTEAVTTGIDRNTLTFVAFNPASTEGSLRRLRETLRQPSILTRLLLPDATTVPSIGEAPKAVPQKVMRGDQDTSPAQKKAIQNKQHTPHFLNMPLIQFFKGLGEYNYLRLRGVDPRVLEGGDAVKNMNVNHLSTQQGVLQGLAQAMDAEQDLEDTVGQSADANDQVLTDVPIYNPAGVVASNARNMDITAVSQQSSKRYRETVSTTKRTLDLTDKNLRMKYLMAVAQALGIKTEKSLSSQVAAAGLAKMYSAPMQALLASVNAFMEKDPEDATEQEAKLLSNQIQQVLGDSAGVVEDRAMHALVDYARLKATEDKTQFVSHLAFELDGKTDGPINALVHFGLWALGTRLDMEGGRSKLLDRLAQGGLLINRQATTLNELGDQLGDLYTNAAAATQNLLTKKHAKLNENTKDNWLELKKLNAVRALFTMAGHIKLSTADTIADLYQVERLPAKEGLTPLGYGAGEHSVVAKLTGQIVDKVYEAISEALRQSVEQEKTVLLPLALRQQLDVLMYRDQPKLDKLSDYAEFSFTEDQIKLLQQSIQFTIGKELIGAIKAQIAPSLDTFDHLYITSAAQVAQYRHAFYTARDKLTAQRVTEGALRQGELLSKNDEETLREKFKALAPVYHLLYAQGEDKSVGASILKRSSQREVAGSKQQVQSILDGSLSMPVDSLTVEDAGVRIASLLTQAMGDATMMTGLLQNIRDALDVYDGYEVTPDKIEEYGLLANQVVLKGWLFDALGSVNQSQTGLMERMDSLPRNELVVIGQSMKDEEGFKYKKAFLEDMDEGDLRDFVKTAVQHSVTTLHKRAAVTRAHKKTLLEGKVTRMATDHMAGAMTPAMAGQDLELLAEDALVPALLAESRKHYDAETQASSEEATVQPTTRPKNMDDVLANLREGQGATMDAAQVTQLLDTTPPRGKVPQFVWNQIKKLLPPNLQVHVGTAEQIALKQAELLPHITFGDKATNGESYGEHIFIKQASGEVLLHELVHAATRGILGRYYAGAKGLTAHQRDAVRELEKLAKGFLQIEGDDTVTQVQGIVSSYFNQGDTVAAVNEFMAYALTSAKVSKRLDSTKMGNGFTGLVKQLSKRVLALVRKALGLPANQQVETYLEQVLGQTLRLTRRPYQDNSAFIPQVLAHALPADTETDRLQHLLDDLAWVNDHTLPDGRDVATQTVDKTVGKQTAEAALTAVLKAGWHMDQLHQQTFLQMHTALSGTALLSPAVVDGMQDLYELAMPVLEKALDTADLTAVERFEALQGVGLKDAGKRSDTLATFISLALVDPTLREELATIEPAKAQAVKGSADERLKAVTTKVFDTLSHWGTHTSNEPHQLAILDRLTKELRTNHENMWKRVRTPPNLAQQVETALKGAIEKGGDKLLDRKAAREAAGKNVSVGDQMANRLLAGLAMVTSDEKAESGQEAFIKVISESNLAKPLKELAYELVGETRSNSPILVLLNQTKTALSRVRQRLREDVPEAIRNAFTEAQDKATWANAHGLLKGDVAALLNGRSLADIRTLAADPKALQMAITEATDRLDPTWRGAYQQAAENLATYMVEQRNPAKGMLWVNAHAISRMPGALHKPGPVVAEANVATIDELVSLLALQKQPQSHKDTLVRLADTEADGTERLLRVAQSLQKQELTKAKAQDQQYNALKGYIPETRDPRHNLVLASSKRAAELVKQGYTKVGLYQGDEDDLFARDMAYYAIRHVGGAPAYNQGALQIVEGTVAGVDALSGRTKGIAVQTMITSKRAVAAITASKRRGATDGVGENLVPVYNANDEVVAYQRMLDPSIIAAHTKGEQDAAEAIGEWMGRQAEEKLAVPVNDAATERLANLWNQEKNTRRKEYVDISRSTDPVIRDAWKTFPEDLRIKLQEAFKGGPLEEGERVPVMVRQDMVNQAIGHRSASVADVFTGMTNLPEPVRKGIENIAYATFGEVAYRNMVIAERALQAGVGTAKDIIVVRSGVVALSNALANQYQLVSHGVPLRDLPKQFAKARELEGYLRREKRLSQVILDKASARTDAERRKLDQEATLLHDANTRLSIWPLIEAGQLPSIAEGLSKQTEYSLFGDMQAHLDKHTDRIPKGVLTAAKYAVIAKDTALYQGLNRAVQFGDFMAKGVLYDHMVAMGTSKEAALRKVGDSFVNYNLLSGRSRDYLESVGVTWFWNYKIRIQKIMLRNIRENPLRFLTMGALGTVTDVDTLMHANALNTSWSYSLGWGQLFRSHGMLAWEQVLN